MAKSPPKVKEITLPLRGYKCRYYGDSLITDEVYCPTSPVHGDTPEAARANVEKSREDFRLTFFYIGLYVTVWAAITIVAAFAGCWPVFVLGFAPILLLLIMETTGIDKTYASK